MQRTLVAQSASTTRNDMRGDHGELIEVARDHEITGIGEH